jgi:2-methylisocitrate lyase-like PEP mutase family enzyme
MPTPTSVLRALLEEGTPFIAADCYSALTGRVVEQVGFKAAYMGGHATSMMHYAIPDNGIYLPSEAAEQAARVAEAISIPLIVDADSLGETVADVHRSVRRYELAGVAGIHIEDEVVPKHSAWDGALYSIEDMAERISVACEARRDPDFVIIARCDELYATGGGGQGSLEEMARRGVAYAEAGADVFLANFADPEQVAVLADEVPIPLASYGPPLPGCVLGLATGWGVAGAVAAHRRYAQMILDGQELPYEELAMEGKDELIRQVEYDVVVERWRARKGLAPSRGRTV